MVERERAYSTVHEGAIYLHLGEQFLVAELDHGGRVALVVEQFRGDWYTQAKKETMTADRRRRSAWSAGSGWELTFGRVSVTEQVVCVPEEESRDRGALDLVALDLPETTFETEAIWYLPEPGDARGPRDDAEAAGARSAPPSTR